MPRSSKPLFVTQEERNKTKQCLQSLEPKGSNISDFSKSEDHSAIEIGWLLPTALLSKSSSSNPYDKLLTNRAHVILSKYSVCLDRLSSSQRQWWSSIMRQD